MTELAMVLLAFALVTIVVLVFSYWRAIRDVDRFDDRLREVMLVNRLLERERLGVSPIWRGDVKGYGSER